MEKTNRWLWHAFLWGFLFVVIFGVIVWTAIKLHSLGNPIRRYVFLGFLTTIDLLWFGRKAMLHLVGGPSCNFRIYTAVQAREIPCLGRLSTGRKFLAQLNPLIESFQGTMPREQIVAQLKGIEQKPAAVISLQSKNSPTKRISGMAHLILFALILCDSAFNSFCLFFPSVILIFLSTATGWGSILMQMMALVQQAGSNLSNSLKKITYGTLLYSLSGMMGMGIFLLIQEFKFAIARAHEHAQTTTWQAHLGILELFATPSFSLKWFVIIETILGCALAIPGFILALQHYYRWSKQEKAVDATP